MLCSLPQSYAPLITSMEARDEKDLDLEFVKNKLIDEFSHRVENKNNGTRPRDTAYKIINKASKKYCSYCHRDSHNRSECYKLKNKQKNTYQKYDNNNRNKFYNNGANFKNNSGNPKNPNDSKTDSSNFCFNSKTNIEDEVNESIIPPFPVENNFEIESVKINQTQTTDSNTYIIDSGCTRHVTSAKINFATFTAGNFGNITIANGKRLNSQGVGDVKLKTNKNHYITLKDVLYCPELKSNLLSVKKATENNIKVIFEKNACLFVKDDNIILTAKLNDNLYVLNPEDDYGYTVSTQTFCNNANCISMWHRRLGHKNFDDIRYLVNHKLADGIIINNCKHDTRCTKCIEGKLSVLPYPKVATNRSKEIGILAHSDLCGPMQTETIGGKRYFITFTDDYSRYTITYLIAHKSEAVIKLKEYISLTKNKFGRLIKSIRSDNAKEYVSDEFENCLIENGIERQLSVPYCSQQNGVSERKNRTIVEMARTMLSDAKLPKQFWGEAVMSATYLINRLPTKANKNNMTPYELWHKRKPDLSNIKTFGCKAFAYIDKPKRGKLDEKAIEGIMLGYDFRSKGYRIHTGGNKIMISRTVKFFEEGIKDEGIEPAKESQNNEQTPADNIEIDLEDHDEGQTNTPTDKSPEPRRSERQNRGVPPNRFGISANLCQIQEPKSWTDLLNINNEETKNKWLKATSEEIESLKQNNTWRLIKPIPGKRVIGCRWTFKAKKGANGSIERYKARLVAKGYAQKYGSDFDETYAPVVAHTTLRAFLNAAVYKNLKITHLDVKTAFLHGDLEEEVYMHQPEGYITKGEEDKVCSLNKAIYGLKQAARAWNQKISKSLRELNFVECASDKCLYKRVHDEKTAYIIVYVDDILVAGDKADTHEIYTELSKQFEIKNLGQVTQYLGINIKETENGNLELDQEHKIIQIAEKFNLLDSKPTYTPMNTNYFNLDQNGKLMGDNVKFRQAIGGLLYVATLTRPDIASVVNILGRRNESPREVDWQAIEKLIRYLLTTKDLKFVIDKTKPPTLTAYSDADWGNDRIDRKSTTGNVFKLGNNTLSWLSRKQTCTALSSTEAEYISASNASQELVWLLDLLNDLELHQQLPVTLYEDNLSAIRLTENEKAQTRTKHIEVKFHHIRHLCQNGIIKITYCPSKLMLADVLTKPLPKPHFECLRNKLNILRSSV